ncbi:helix-turn-helix domain-containing protein [Actomonas aquatica]|uniref:Helix-turn-helix transcriptional regulator n=1 Tax=Actomonas aquatica TaxID=2866162 RepID=A0ABZ1C4X2_9BACT|nr:helix-turn-helix transcriptional regulator [Opitutus sp. WL0086]WRQ86521.1 helix-turn-helix transcriptional regulator [Opitutus sp. WL0086]
MTELDRLTRDLHTRIAKAIRQERVKRNLSMLAVAEQAGLSQQMVSYVERGIRKPSLDTFVRLAHVLRLDLSQLFESDGKRRNKA